MYFQRMAKSKKILSKHHIVTHTLKDLDLFADCVALSLDPEFFKKSETSNDVVGILLNGTQNSGKSRISDRMGVAMIPESARLHALSYYGNEELWGQYSSFSGPSRFSWLSSCDYELSGTKSGQLLGAL